MVEIQLDLLQSVGLVGLVLVLGYWLKDKVDWLGRLTIPAAVMGGLVFAILNTIFYILDIGYITIDTGLNNFFMVIYFTTIGLSASLSKSRGLGSTIGKLLLLSAAIIIIQNVLAIGVGSFFDIDGPLAMMIGSVPLLGGPGNVAAIGPQVESLGYPQAITVGMTVATLGITLGGLLAGPTGERLIQRHKLTPSDSAVAAAEEELKQNGDRSITSKENVFQTVIIILVAMFLGSFITQAIDSFMQLFWDGIAFPIVLGPMLLGFLFRLISDRSENSFVPDDGVDTVADISLDIFLGLTIIDLQFWLIFDIAGAMILILILEVIVTLLFVYFVVFRVMGSDFDAAVMSTGVTGFMLGTTTNAMSGIREIREKYGPSPKAVLAVSIICGVFLDFLNVVMVYGFLGFMA